MKYGMWTGELECRETLAQKVSVFVALSLATAAMFIMAFWAAGGKAAW